MPSLTDLIADAISDAVKFAKSPTLRTTIITSKRCQLKPLCSLNDRFKDSLWDTICHRTIRPSMKRAQSLKRYSELKRGYVWVHSAAWRIVLRHSASKTRFDHVCLYLLIHIPSQLNFVLIKHFRVNFDIFRKC